MKAMRFLLCLLPAIIVAACDSGDDDDGQISGVQTAGQISFEIGFAGENSPGLRVATAADFSSTWEDGDEIGLFAVRHAIGANAALQPSGNYIHNVKLTYSGGAWTPETALYWPGGDYQLDFYACCPYDANMTDPTDYTFAVKADQSATTGSKSNYSLSDLLTAKAVNQTKGAAVSLQFSHMLSLLQVEVKREVNVPYFDDNLTVTLAGALPAVTLNLDGGLTAAGTATDIVMRKADGLDYTYRALAPAQTLTADTKVTFVQTTTGKELDMQYPGVASAALTAAKAQKYSVTLGWDIDPDHVYAVGDVYPHTGRVIGIVYEIDAGGKHGKVVGLQETKDRWGVYETDEQAAGVTGIRSITDGKTATRNLINKRKDEADFATNYFVFNWIYQTMNNGNADGDWYLPAQNELRSLYYVKATVNTSLVAVGGVVLSDTMYWSSSEYDVYNVSIVNLGYGFLAQSLKDFGFASARCVLAF